MKSLTIEVNITLQIVIKRFSIDVSNIFETCTLPVFNWSWMHMLVPNWGDDKVPASHIIFLIVEVHVSCIPILDVVDNLSPCRHNFPHLGIARFAFVCFWQLSSLQTIICLISFYQKTPRSVETQFIYLNEINKI